MCNSNKKKTDQLGMPHGTASARLRKSLIFHLIQQLGLDICFQCKNVIENESEMSIEHKIPWLDSEDPIKLFFDIENISFSHLRCNIGQARQTKDKMTVDHPKLKHGTNYAYDTIGCRCEMCKELKRNRNKLRYSQ